MSISVVTANDVAMVQLVPPQTLDANLGPTKGAYCFVIDVSGSMNAAAAVTNDDGDKVDHGWSMLDIAKHSTSSFVSSLEDADYVCLITYSDGAAVLLDWTLCNATGRERAIQAIDSMKPQRSTNLMAGIVTGFDKMTSLPAGMTLSEYSLNLIITTDGMPSAQWHPARGRDGYGPLIKACTAKTVGARGLLQFAMVAGCLRVWGAWLHGQTMFVCIRLCEC